MLITIRAKFQQIYEFLETITKYISIIYNTTYWPKQRPLKNHNVSVRFELERPVFFVPSNLFYLKIGANAKVITETWNLYFGRTSDVRKRNCSSGKNTIYRQIPPKEIEQKISAKMAVSCGYWLAGDNVMLTMLLWWNDNIVNFEQDQTLVQNLTLTMVLTLLANKKRVNNVHWTTIQLQ